MEMILLIVAFLLGGLLDMEAEALTVTAPLGEDVKIKCVHSNAFYNFKYFCKGKCSDAAVLISSRGKKEASNGRYSISDEGNTFYVTISHLTVDDSGTYWCGIERNGPDTYTKVVLTVTQDIQLPQRKHFLSSKKLVYIGGGFGVVLLALAILLLMFIRQRRGYIITPTGKDHDATAFSQKQDAQPVVTASPSPTNHYQETDDDRNNSSAPPDQGCAGVTYASVTVASEPRSQAGDLLYSSVSHSTHTNRSSISPAGADVTYSAISFKSAAEPSVYCNI